MPFRSKLFLRNQGGHGKVGGGLYLNRRTGGFHPPNPSPPQGRAQINTKEKKQRTFNLQSTPAFKTAPPNHLDIIAQGAGASQRIGQKFKVTGIHIRGEMALPTESGIRTDTGGYYLVWDRQPNKSLAVIGDVLDEEAGAVTSADAFPLASNESRFVVLARKSHNLIKRETAAGSFDDRKTIDDYFQFRKTLIATCQNVDELGGSALGTIGTRTSGALLMLPFGNNTAQITFEYSYRLYFEDV